MKIIKWKHTLLHALKLLLLTIGMLLESKLAIEVRFLTLSLVRSKATLSEKVAFLEVGSQCSQKSRSKKDSRSLKIQVKNLFS